MRARIRTRVEITMIERGSMGIKPAGLTEHKPKASDFPEYKQSSNFWNNAAIAIATVLVIAIAILWGMR